MYTYVNTRSSLKIITDFFYMQVCPLDTYIKDVIDFQEICTPYLFPPQIDNVLSAQSLIVTHKKIVIQLKSAILQRMRQLIFHGRKTSRSVPSSIYLS